MPSLMAMVSMFKDDLACQGSFNDVITQACAQLEIDPSGMPLPSRARWLMQSHAYVDAARARVRTKDRAHVSIHMQMAMHVHMPIHTPMSMHTSIHKSTRIYSYACVYLHVSMHVCTHVCASFGTWQE